MTSTILATKLYIPAQRLQAVLRPRLIEKLNKGLPHKLTVISAPAGFGKTTLVSEWIASCGRPVAWLSLDEADHDPIRFLIYLISALQKITPNLGEEVLQALQSLQPPPIETILTTLLNEINTIQDNFIIVLDDYHMIDSNAVDHALTFIVEHQPQQMHLIITTREDPNLPLARLRVRNQLTEIRAEDLRFSPTEATEFLSQVMDLNLSSEEIATLETRTEGWIAGLQLAALSMQGHQDIPGFIQAFAGDHRYIVDYLVEEVLKRQPELTRNFLLQSAILDRFNGSLCDAVTSQKGGKVRLEALERGNFFLIPMDDKHHWYRYHHLFADVLLMHLMTEQPDQIPTLHQRASAWYEQEGFSADAICHAFAAEDFERAANLVELAAPVMRKTRQEATLLGCLKALPEGLFLARPVLSIEYVGALLSNGESKGVEVQMRNAERWLENLNEGHERPKDMIVMNEEEFQRLPGLIAMYRAAIALSRGDVVETMKYASEVLVLAQEDDYFMRGAASSMLGLAHWTRGDLESAYRIYSNGMAYLRQNGYISDVIGGFVTLADIQITQGHLIEAKKSYEHGLQLATKPGAPTLRGAADMFVGLSEIYRERNDLHSALQQLLKSKQLGDLNGLPKNPYRSRVAMARLREIQGNLSEALDLLEEAEKFYLSDFSPNVHPIQALKVRIWIKQGEIEKAFVWAQERNLSATEDVSYLREFEQITFARILLYQYQHERTIQFLQEALEMLNRLLRAADEGGRRGSVIEILILLSIVHQLRGEIPAAHTSLVRALKMAEPEGYMRVFLDEGSSLEKLIREVNKRRILPDYTRKLISAFETDQQSIDNKFAPVSGSQKSSSLVEPLSQRELDILRLLKTDLSGPEIAQEFVIALSTVRTHSKSIYSKLNVNNRQGAVKRAIELGLI